MKLQIKVNRIDLINVVWIAYLGKSMRIKVNKWFYIKSEVMIPIGHVNDLWFKIRSKTKFDEAT